MKVLVGFIMSPEGEAALDAAIAEATLRNAQLVVVHSLFGGGRDEGKLPAYTEALRAVGARLDNEPINYEIRELVRGNAPGDDLLAFARDEAVSLIVIGLRRRSPVGKLVLGSNAQDILLGADCPVLAVKA
ncbi:MAG TPA: universal stress protein [Euzebya sp.]|nr:universal stress protein [Euzebya sp.]